MPEVILQSVFSRILTFSGWPGLLNANGYKYAMLYLDATIKDACYSSKATLPKIDFKEIREVVPFPRSGHIYFDVQIDLELL